MAGFPGICQKADFRGPGWLTELREWSGWLCLTGAVLMDVARGHFDAQRDRNDDFDKILKTGKRTAETFLIYDVGPFFKSMLKSLRGSGRWILTKS